MTGFISQFVLVILTALLLFPTRAHSGVIVGWAKFPSGATDYGQASAPSDLTNVLAIAAGGAHSLAMTEDGRAVPWGWAGPLANNNVTLDGLTDFSAIAAGGIRNYLLTGSGDAVTWPPYTNHLTGNAAISAGGNYNTFPVGSGHALALTEEGRVVAWGVNNYGQATVPPGLREIVAVSAGGYHSLALTAEGRVVAWGRNDFGQTTVPADLRNVVAIAAGYSHNLALTEEGRVVAWGTETTVPADLSDVVAIAAGGDHSNVRWVGNIFSLALRSDGRVVGWGSVAPPSGLANVGAIAAGAFHGLALVGLPPGTAAPVLVGETKLVGTTERRFHRRVFGLNGVDSYSAAGLPPGLQIHPAIGLISGTPIEAGRFTATISASNALGVATSELKFYINASHGISLASVRDGVFTFELEPPTGDACTLMTATSLDTNTIWTPVLDLPSNQEGRNSFTWTNMTDQQIFFRLWMR